MLTPLEGELSLGLTIDAFQPQDDLLGRLGLPAKHRFRLTSIPGLFPVVTSFTLGE